MIDDDFLKTLIIQMGKQYELSSQVVYFPTKYIYNNNTSFYIESIENYTLALTIYKPPSVPSRHAEADVIFCVHISHLAN